MARGGPLGLYVGTLLGLLLGLAPQPAAGAALFRTPRNAAYCYISERNLAPENPILGCWTPNDGFTATVSHASSPTDVRKRYVPANRGRAPTRGYRLLRFGQTYRWRCTEVTISFAEGCGSGRGRTVFRCASRSTGLTCTNRKGHGFWLGRYVGYRIF